MHLIRPARVGPRGRRWAGAAAALAVALASTTAGLAPAASSAAPVVVADKPSKASAKAPVDLGANVVVFDPSMPVSQIQATMDATHAKQVDNEMGQERYAFLFKPGTYGTDDQPLQVKVGYYTEVAGLGASPSDVVINGKVEVYNRCLENGGTSNCLALVNFWRTISNLTLKVNGKGQDGCRASANFWAVSQAVSMRRLDVSGANLSLQDYCTPPPQWASGGFIADSRLPFVINGGQQQWLTRNSEVAGWSNGVWNQVFSGVVGAPDDSTFPKPPYTTLDTTSVSREKPYLFIDDQGAYQVRVPSLQRNTRGVSWDEGVTAGRTIPLTDFAVVKPTDPVATINRALAAGKHLLFTPGHYEVDETIRVDRADTVVLGIGHATLNARNGATPVKIADQPGIVIAGITIEAGAVESEHLMQVGVEGGHRGAKSLPHNPITLSDVYFRVGGSQIGKVDVALEVNADHTLIDHTWVWRADHGIEGFGHAAAGDDERWAKIIGRNGVVVNGDDVTATGLFVEHFQEYNTIWNGQRGTVVLYQNELPYDPPSQAHWMNGDVEGWAGYKVADHVRKHRLYGGGVYVFNQNEPSIHTENGFEVPDRANVRLHHIMTVNLGAGILDHVVNGIGIAAIPEKGEDPGDIGVPVYVADYPATTP